MASTLERSRRGEADLGYSVDPLPTPYIPIVDNLTTNPLWLPLQILLGEPHIVTLVSQSKEVEPIKKGMLLGRRDVSNTPHQEM